MVSNSRFHCGSRAKRTMNTAEIVKREVERESGFEILPLLRESIGQPRQSANPHSHGQVLSFDVRGTNPLEARPSPFWERDCSNDFRRRVPRLGLSRASVNFYQLREINASAKAVVNGLNVGLESISGDLEAALCRFADFICESLRVACRAAPKVPRQNQLCVSFNGDEGVGIPARGIAARIVFFFAADKAPQFVTLNVRHRDVADSTFQKPLALLANQNEQRKNCCVVESSQAFDRTDRAPFNKKLNRLGSLLQRRVHAAKRRGMVLGKRLAALITAETLKAVAVFSKFLTARIAVVTGHFGLPFCGSKPIMFLGSALRLTPRADLAPLSGRTEGGAFYSLLLKSRKSSQHSSIAFVKEVYGLAVRSSLFQKSASRSHSPSQNGVEHGQRICKGADIHTTQGKLLHNICGSKGRARLRHQNLTAQLWKCCRRSNSGFIGKRLKRSNRFFELTDPLRNKCQFSTPFLKFSYSGQVARFIRIDVYVCHFKGRIS